MISNVFITHRPPASIRLWGAEREREREREEDCEPLEEVGGGGGEGGLRRDIISQQFLTFYRLQDIAHKSNLEKH